MLAMVFQIIKIVKMAAVPEVCVSVPLSRYMELMKLEEVKELLGQVQCEQNSNSRSANSSSCRVNSNSRRSNSKFWSAISNSRRNLYKRSNK